MSTENSLQGPSSYGSSEEAWLHCNAARSLGVSCNVRQWLDGERGWFVVDDEHRSVTVVVRRHIRLSVVNLDNRVLRGGVQMERMYAQGGQAEAIFPGRLLAAVNQT